MEGGAAPGGPSTADGGVSTSVAVPCSPRRERSTSAAGDGVEPGTSLAAAAAAAAAGGALAAVQTLGLPEAVVAAAAVLQQAVAEVRRAACVCCSVAGGRWAVVVSGRVLMMFEHQYIICACPSDALGPRPGHGLGLTPCLADFLSLTPCLAAVPSPPPPLGNTLCSTSHHRQAQLPALLG